MEQMTQAPSIGVIVSLVTYTLTCGTFLIALAMIRGFVVRGISLSIAEFILRSRDDEQTQKLCRWFGNGEEIAEYLKDIKEKMSKE